MKPLAADGLARARALWRRPFVRFLLVGALNTAFGYAVYSVLVAWLRYELALAIAFVLGVLFNFRTTGVLVFRSGEVRRLFRFVLVYVPIYGANVLLIRAVKQYGLGDRLAQAVCIPLITVVTFFALKLLVFRTPQAPPPSSA